MTARLRPLPERMRRTETGTGSVAVVWLRETLATMAVAGFRAAEESTWTWMLVGTATAPSAGLTVAVVTWPAREMARPAVSPATTVVLPLPTRDVFGTWAPRVTLPGRAATT